MTTTDTTTSVLPEQFADLERFADWSLEHWADRYDKRLASSMEEMQELYDAVFPRGEEIIEYCNRYTMDDLPDDVRNLMRLMFSFIEVSFPIEVWRQPRVPDSGAAAVECVTEPTV